LKRQSSENESGFLPKVKVTPRKRRVKFRKFTSQSLFSETFPYVYHVAGQLTCPRYDKLFHENKQFSVRTDFYQYCY
jgi:hypothetical protein